MLKLVTRSYTDILDVYDLGTQHYRNERIIVTCMKADIVVCIRSLKKQRGSYILGRAQDTQTGTR